MAPPSVITRRAFSLGALAALAAPEVRASGLSSLPHVSLGCFPTPVDHAEELGEHLGIARLYVKRDDLGGKPYGGSKLRKLEPLLGQALAQKRQLVVTFGGVGSNQAVATSVYASRLGMKTLLLLLPQPPSAEVRENLLADAGYGAELRMSPGQSGQRAAALHLAAARGETPYIIPMGGSSPLGNSGFVKAAHELAAQVRAGVLPEPDVIYIAMGTMGSAVGLALGLRAAGMKTHVVAVRASNRGTSTPARFFALSQRTAAFLHAHDAALSPRALSPRDVTLDGRHLGRGYALSTRKGRAAMNLARHLAGLELEPVYTAKALSALIDDAPHLENKVVLFWNTHNSRPLDLHDVAPGDLPRAFHGYFAGSRQGGAAP
jgi:D-cysteine desulfhydrase